MFAFLASALLPLRRNPFGERTGTPETDTAPRASGLALVPPPGLIQGPTMSSDPSPISRTIDAMLKVLKGYLVPPLLQPPPPPPLPAPSVVLSSVVERSVGLGGRVGTDVRGPFSVAALKGLRVETVVRYELWAHTPAEIGQVVDDLIKEILADRDLLRTQGFLRVALQSTTPSENVFAEEAWRQSVAFDVLFEFPYVDSDGAESLIARIPIDFKGETNESTLVVDQMARWDNEDAPPLVVRGPITIGALSALAFIAGAEPTGAVSVTRTFDGASGPPASHPTLSSFVTAVGGTNPAERHAEATFVSLNEFLSAIASFKITDKSLAGMTADGVAPNVVTSLTALKDQEVAGENEFVALVQATIGPADTATFKAQILQHAATLTPVTMGDWDKNDIPDEYRSLQFRVQSPIQLTGVTDRLEIAYEHSNLNQVAVFYLRATRGPTA
jgi:hypothetical protein